MPGWAWVKSPTREAGVWAFWRSPLKRLISNFSGNFTPKTAKLRVNLSGALKRSRDVWKNVFTPHVFDELCLR